jgi:hypothetical protein
MLRRGAFGEAEALLEPLTSYDDARHRAAAWAWLGVARLGGGLAGEAADAAYESLAANPDEPVARYVLYRTGRL